MTQVALSEQLGWRGNARLASYETGRNVPPLEVVAAIAALLRCPPGWLAFGDAQGSVSLPEWRTDQPRLIPAWLLVGVDADACCWAKIAHGGECPDRVAAGDVLVVGRDTRSDGALHAVATQGGVVARVLRCSGQGWTSADGRGELVPVSLILGRVLALLRAEGP